MLCCVVIAWRRFSRSFELLLFLSCDCDVFILSNLWSCEFLRRKMSINLKREEEVRISSQEFKIKVRTARFCANL